MDENKTQLFRQSSLDSIENPESLNDYLRVTSPGVWMLLTAIILLLIGTCIWGIFGKLTSYTDVTVVSEDGATYCLVPEKAMDDAIADRVIEINGAEYTLDPTTDQQPVIVGLNDNLYNVLSENLNYGDIIYKVPLTESLAEGSYTGRIVTERISPISLLLN